MDAQPPQNSDSFHTILSEYKTRLLDPTNIVICIAAALLFAIIGPYGTNETGSFWGRLLLWSLLVWSTCMSALFFGVWANVRFKAQPFWFQSPVGSNVFSALYLFLIWITLRAIYPPLSQPGSTEFYFVTICVTFGLYCSMWCFAYMIESRIKQQIASTKQQSFEPPTSATKAPKNAAQNHLTETSYTKSFLKQIGPDAGTRLIRLAMSDHYIEAHTDTGMHLLYMRFADATAALAQANGTQVHRSHWINLDEVTAVTKNGPKIAFTMSDGSTIPVSRNRKKDLQSRGIL